VGESVRQTLDNAQGDLTRLGQTMDTVNQRLPGLLDRTQQVIDQASGVIGHVEKIAAQAEVSVPPVLQNTDAIAADVREVVSGAKTTWPLNSLVDAPAPQKLKIDSEPAIASKAQSPKPSVNGGKP
jgi:ABC-type transporter Mla subunit MlaD